MYWKFTRSPTLYPLLLCAAFVLSRRILTQLYSRNKITHIHTKCCLSSVIIYIAH
jgi:hypothetical protein